jgi:HD-GYP domain-containing protein (c-di-GMP phosphodiesterase class II)
VNVTCSAGVADITDPGIDTPLDLVNCADRALFAAKDRGRNQVVLYSDLTDVGGEHPREGEKRLAELTASFAAPLHEFKSAYVKTIQALVEVAELREPGARGHSRQVAGYARAMGASLGMSDYELAALVNGALLHDVGKVVVPERVLQKPGPLTSDEWALVRRHPLAGAQALQRALMLPDEMPAIVHHHEHWDGSGYPHGLAGERIPRMARIIAVADAYDAMTMGRAYEPRHTQEQAFDALRRDAGTQFDPELVARFIELTRGKAPGIEALPADEIGAELHAQVANLAVPPGLAEVEG